MPFMAAVTAPLDTALNLAQLRADVLSGRAQSIRKRARLSQDELAAAIGTVRSTVCSWEQQRRLPRGDLARRYSAVLVALERQQRERGGG